MKNLILLLTLAALTACGSKNENDSYDPAVYNTGLIVGDSVMRGLPLTEYKGLTMENLAVGGTHCSDALEVLKSSPPRRLVILGCGHNGTDPARVIPDIQEVIDWCSVNCGRLIIVNLNPVRSREGREAKVKVINEWLSMQDIEVLDFYHWSVRRQDPYFFKDGLHPTAEGYQHLIQDLFLQEGIR